MEVNALKNDFLSSSLPPPFLFLVQTFALEGTIAKGITQLCEAEKGLLWVDQIKWKLKEASGIAAQASLRPNENWP